MKHLFSNFTAMLAAACLYCSCAAGEKTFVVNFDGEKEMSGQKFALKDINPELPADWDEYNFVVLEYKISTAQRFQLGFTTADGYNELRIMSYVPNAWNKIAIPLHYFVDLPDAAVDLAATNNHARFTGWINLGGKRGLMHDVDSIGFRMRKAIGNPTLELRNVTLFVEDPGDEYLNDIPAIDEFGQSNLVEYAGKVHSLEELQRYWKEEEDEVVTTEAFNYSKFGGYKQKKADATGFFHTVFQDGKWWFVDPEGYLFLSVGVDCVSAGGGGWVRGYEERSNMYAAIPPQEVLDKFPSRRGNPNISLGLWNQYRRYGDDFLAKSKEMIFKRMDKWGLNTIANWSDTEVMKMNRKAFLLPLHNLGMDPELMGLCDVYAPDFKENVTKALTEFTQPYLKNPWLIGYFIGNEPAWLDEEPRLCSLILEGKDRPIKKALQEYLEKNGDTPENRTTFVIESFDTFLTVTNHILKKADPDHLNLGIRFGNIMKLDERILKSCGKAFDVLSFNCYDLVPDKAMMDRALEIAKLPMIIGEYHFGTVDHGLAQSLWQVDNQQQRGVAYRYYTENAYAHPGLIGTGYFQWCDQDITGRGDGENYNCGLIDITDRPYVEQVEAMIQTAMRLYDVHNGTQEPVTEQPKNARGHELVPDLWNE